MFIYERSIFHGMLSCRLYLNGIPVLQQRTRAHPRVTNRTYSSRLNHIHVRTLSPAKETVDLYPIFSDTCSAAQMTCFAIAGALARVRRVAGAVTLTPATTRPE